MGFGLHFSQTHLVTLRLTKSLFQCACLPTYLSMPTKKKLKLQFVDKNVIAHQDDGFPEVSRALPDCRRAAEKNN
jgi:hypothetical protein